VAVWFLAALRAIHLNIIRLAHRHQPTPNLLTGHSFSRYVF